MDLNFIDNIFWIVIIISVIAGIGKVLFWFFIGMGIFNTSQNYQQNFLAQLLGIPAPRPSIKDLESTHRRRYAFSGLVIGTMIILIGALMIFSGLDGGEINFRFAGAELNRAGPGTVLCVLGVIIIKFTKGE